MVHTGWLSPKLAHPALLYWPGPAQGTTPTVALPHQPLIRKMPHSLASLVKVFSQLRCPLVLILACVKLTD